MKKIIVFLILFSCSQNSQENSNTIIELNSVVEIYLLENFDESRGYCIDVRGSKTSANIDRPLQAHTCYSYQGTVSVDQGFDESQIINNQFRINFFNVCMEAESMTEYSQVILQTCNNNSKQKFIIDNNGKIYLQDDKNLCLTVSEISSEGGGGNPVHMIKTLTLQICSDELTPYQSWGIRK